MKNEQLEHIVHSLPPVYDENCKVLINGSMLSPKSREHALYYGHPQNRFWKVICSLWDDPVPNSAEEKHGYALEHHIALWNVIAECDIRGASDATIKNVVANDMNKVLENTEIKAIFNLGKKAGELFQNYCQASLKTPVYVQVLPSTSPANAAWSLEALIKEFEIVRIFADGK